jgi:hypothetical protein
VAFALRDADWSEFSSRRFGFKVALPDARGWSLNDDSERWFALSHARSESSLDLRTWRTERRVHRDQCLEQVYLWRGDLRTSVEPVLSRRLSSPSQFDVHLLADVRPAETGGLQLVAIAYGAAVGRCYAAVFRTRAAGGGADAELGQRLRMMVDGCLERVEVLAIDQLPREPLRELR